MWWSRPVWGLLFVVACGASCSNRPIAHSGSSGGGAATAGTGGSNTASGTAGASTGGAGTGALGGTAGAPLAGAGSSGTAQGGTGGDSSAAGAGQRPALTELKADGFDRTEVYAISADGTYVAGMVTNSADESLARGVRWTDAAPTLLETRDGWNRVQPRGISADGSVLAGIVFTGAGNRAFIWKGTTVDFLQGLQGVEPFSEAYALSGNGKVVLGRVYDPNSATMYGAAWFDGSLTTLPEPTGFMLPVPTGTSFDGTQSVGIGFAMDQWAGVRWVADDVANITARLVNEELADVSSDGRWFVGTANTTGTVFRGDTTTSKIEQIPNVVGALQCKAAATNANGSVVVGNCLAGALYVRPFLWSEKDGTVPLDSVFAKLGIDQAVYESCQIVDISASGSMLLLYGGKSTGSGSITIGVRLRLEGVFN